MDSDLLQQRIWLYSSGHNLIDSQKYADVLSYIVRERDLVNVFSTRLKSCREAADLSQEKLGTEIGVSSANISYMENPGKKRKGINITYLLYFCLRLGASPEYMLGFVDAPDQYIFVNDGIGSSNDSFENCSPKLAVEALENPAYVLEAWEKEEKLVLHDPMHFLPCKYVQEASTIASSLWNENFDLLYALSLLSEKKHDTCDLIHLALKETFLANYKTPDSSDCDFLWFTPSAPFGADVETWEKLRKLNDARKSEDKVKANKRPKAGKDTQNAPLGSINIEIAHGAYLEVCRKLVNLGNVSEALLEDFTKIAILPDSRKSRIQTMLECFIFP